jgi:O-antigen ligase
MRLGRGRWPAIGLALQVLASEFEPSVFGQGSSTASAVRYLLLLVGAIAPMVLVVLRSSILPEVLRRAPVNYLCAFLAWFTIAAVWSIDPAHALPPALWMTSVALYAVWFVSTSGWYQFRLTVGVALAAFVIGCAAYQLVVPGDGRLKGVSGGPTNLGLLSGLLVILSLSMPSTSIRIRRLRLVGTAVGVYGVFATSTRTVAIGLLIVGTYLLARRMGRSAALVVAIAGLAFVVAFTSAAGTGIVIVAHTPDGTDFVDSRNGVVNLSHTPGASEYTTATGRTQVWAAGWTELQKRPIFGWGTGSSERLFNELAAQGRLEWLALGAHNAALGILLAQGAIGLALFFAAGVSYVRVARRVPDLTRSALLVLLVIDGLSESIFDTGRISMIILAGAFAATANRAHAVDRARLRASITWPSNRSIDAAVPRLVAATRPR